VRREEAREHANGAAGIAGVERAGRRLEAAHLDAEDFQVDAGGRIPSQMLDWHPQAAQAGQGGGAIRAGRIALNHRRSFGDGGEQGVTVGNRLVAGRPDAAAHRAGRLHRHRERGGHYSQL